MVARTGCRELWQGCGLEQFGYAVDFLRVFGPGTAPKACGVASGTSARVHSGSVRLCVPRDCVFRAAVTWLWQTCFLRKPGLRSDWRQ